MAKFPLRKPTDCKSDPAATGAGRDANRKSAPRSNRATSRSAAPGKLRESRAARRERQARAVDRISIRAGGNAFADDAQARHGMRPESRRVLVLAVVFAIVFVSANLLPTHAFDASLTEYPLSAFLADVSNNLASFVAMFAGYGQAFETRFMAVLVCAVGGAALGLCGSTFQGAFNNPLAAPKTLGVMSGGALGALVYVLWLKQYSPTMSGMHGSVTVSQMANWEATLDPFSWFYLHYGRCLCSIVGCFVVVGIVVALTSFLGRGKLSNIIVIIFGQVFSIGVTALIQFGRYFFTVGGDSSTALELSQIENYTMVNTYYFRDLFIVVLPIVVCMVAVLLLRNRLTLLSFGDDVANTMGINVKRTRYGMIALCTVMTALAISFCGHVAFLGFISAHISRRIVGSDFRWLLPASLFTGGALITVIEWICQSGLPFTSTYAAGPVCSILGACLFMVIILRQQGEGNHAWK